VTGSARLDFYRFGGDSLQGRYHLLRLHPFSAKELGISTTAGLADLLKLGGFPEPFLRLRDRGAALVAGVSQPVSSRGRSRASSASRTSETLNFWRFDCPSSSELSAFHKRAAREPADQPQDGSRLASSARAPLRHLPIITFRRAAHSRGKKGAETLPFRLVPRALGCSPLRKPRRFAPVEMGAFRAGRARPGRGAALLPRHRRPRGGLCRRGRAGEAKRGDRLDPRATMEADHGGDPVSTGHLAIEEHAGHAVCPVKTTVNKSCQRQRTRTRGLSRDGIRRACLERFGIL
jgi:hypothetical protein